jgi:hypothetical protein
MRANFEGLTHKGRKIYTGLGHLEDNNPTSCVLLALLFHDLQGTPTPPFICKGCGVTREVTESVRYNDPVLDSISTCLITRYIYCFHLIEIFYLLDLCVGLLDAYGTRAECR